jgi:hypothetical protein
MMSKNISSLSSQLACKHEDYSDFGEICKKLSAENM